MDFITVKQVQDAISSHGRSLGLGIGFGMTAFGFFFYMGMREFAKTTELAKINEMAKKSK